VIFVTFDLLALLWRLGVLICACFLDRLTGATGCHTFLELQQSCLVLDRLRAGTVVAMREFNMSSTAGREVSAEMDVQHP
jgi:hypothetical protein